MTYLRVDSRELDGIARSFRATASSLLGAPAGFASSCSCQMSAQTSALTDEVLATVGYDLRTVAADLERLALDLERRATVVRNGVTPAAAGAALFGGAATLGAGTPVTSAVGTGVSGRGVAPTLHETLHPSTITLGANGGPAWTLVGPGGAPASSSIHAGTVLGASSGPGFTLVPAGSGGGITAGLGSMTVGGPQQAWDTTIQVVPRTTAAAAAPQFPLRSRLPLSLPPSLPPSGPVRDLQTTVAHIALSPTLVALSRSAFAPVVPPSLI